MPKTKKVKIVLTDRAALESVLSPEQVSEVESMAVTLADHSLASDTFALTMVTHVKAVWPKGCRDWATWKEVRGVIFATFGEYGARCLRNAYDAANIGPRPTASGNANGNASKGKMTGAKWVNGAEKRAADFVAFVAKCPKKDIDRAHVAKFIAMAKSLVLEVKAAREDLAA